MLMDDKFVRLPQEADFRFWHPEVTAALRRVAR